MFWFIKYSVLLSNFCKSRIELNPPASSVYRLTVLCLSCCPTSTSTWSCTTGWLFSVRAAALLQPQLGLALQVGDDDRIKCTLLNFEINNQPQLGLALQVGDDDKIKCTLLNFERLWNAKHFFAVTVSWRSHWGLQIAVTYEIIVPWWASKLRNVGTIPQMCCQII